MHRLLQPVTRAGGILLFGGLASILPALFLVVLFSIRGMLHLPVQLEQFYNVPASDGGVRGFVYES
jgi:hypothetical protein